MARATFSGSEASTAETQPSCTPDETTDSALCWGEVRRQYATDINRIRAQTAELERGLPLRDGRSTFAEKVSFAEAADWPIHRWYTYKEGFSPSLLASVLKEVEIPANGWLLDCFGGVGTSVLAATGLRSQVFVGAAAVEFNPFAAFTARTKLAARTLSAATLRELGLRTATARVSTLGPIPPSATIRNPKIYSAHRVREIRRLLAAIDLHASGGYRDVLRLAVASILEPVSNARKDGRALRIVTGKKPAPVRQAFLSLIERMAADIGGAREEGGGGIPVLVFEGDARQLPPAIDDDSVSLALFSPPYLNAIDYSEVYKVEEWFLGFIKSSADLMTLRHGTLRSHQSIRFPPRTSSIPDSTTVGALLAQVSEFIAKYERRPFQKQFSWLIPAYFDDMYRVLREQSRVLAPGGYAVCVVANSLLAKSVEVSGPEGAHMRELWRLPLATDALIAALGRLAGLETVCGIWARSLRPRNAKRAWSRETLVIMRKAARH